MVKSISCAILVGFGISACVKADNSFDSFKQLQTLSAFPIKPIKVKALDWDGVFTKDVRPLTQARMALSVVPGRVVATTLMRNIGTLCTMAGNSGCKLLRKVASIAGYSIFADKALLRKANGDKCIGHSDFIEVFAEKAPELKPYIKPIMKACAKAEPYLDTIDQIQKWRAKGYFIVVWTNNNGPMLKARLKELNKQLTLIGKPTVELDGYFVTGAYAKNASPVGKPHVGYYQHAFAYTQELLAEKGYTNIDFKVCFVDDKKENIAGFQEFAKTIVSPTPNGTQLMALLHENQEAFRKVLAQAKQDRAEQKIEIMA